MATATKMRNKDMHTKIEEFLEDYFAQELKKLHSDNDVSKIYMMVEKPYKIKVESAELRRDMNYDVEFRDVKNKESAKRGLSKCIMSIKEDEMRIIKWIKLDLIGPIFH